MPAPDIILKKGTILVAQGSSSIGIELISQGYLFGYVELVNDLCNGTVLGELVVFNEKQVLIQFKYGSTIYYILEEGQNLFKEAPLP